MQCENNPEATIAVKGDIPDAAHRPIRVAKVTNIPAPYRLPVYDRLIAEKDIDLKLIYCSGKEPDRAWDLGETAVSVQYLRERFITFSGRYIHINPDVWGALKVFKPDVVITSGFNPTHLIAIAYAWRHGVRHIAMTDGTLRSEKKLSLIHRVIRRMVYAGTQAFVGASEGSFDLFNTYGIDRKRMFKSHLCADNPAFLNQTAPQERLDFIFCGRFVAIKNPLFALEVARETAIRLGRSVSIMFVGSGELEDAIRQHALAIQDLVEAHFPGFSTQAELPQRYAAARVFLFPTSWDPWGVVANEACAAGLPVIVTHEAGVAGELVRHERNGFVLPLVMERWVDAAVALLQDDPLYGRMSAESRHAVADYTYDNAAKGLAQAVRFAMDAQEQPFIAALRPRAKPRKVVIVQRRLTNYRVPLFEQLRHRLETSGVELFLVHGDPTQDERRKKDEGFISWAEHAPCHYFINGQICWQNFREQTEGADLVILTQENKLIYNLVALTVRRPKLVAFWGHGRNLQARKRDVVLERFKRLTTKRVDWWFAYTGLSVDLVKEQGFPPDRITNLENAIDTRTLSDLVAAVDDAQLVAQRDEMGLTLGLSAIFIGSLYEEKRIDFLIEAATRVAARLSGFCLVVVGDGIQRSLVESAANVHPCIKYVGAKSGMEKARLLRLADVFMNPGLIGLSILDAFVAGLPMVTTEGGLHSPEIDYLRNGENGLMTQDAMEVYVDAIVAVLEQDALRNRLSQGARASTGRYTIENMTERFATGILQCLDVVR